MGWAIVDDKTDPPSLDGDYVRDEGEQVAYLRDLLEIFEQENFDSAFWFTFAGYELPHRSDPRYDLDMASYGVVKILEEGRGRAYPLAYPDRHGLGAQGVLLRPRRGVRALTGAFSP